MTTRSTTNAAKRLQVRVPVSTAYSHLIRLGFLHTIFTTGYYIDYMSCYYMPTHDLYREYYDSLNNFVVYCTKGYIMTGISKKISPWTQLYNIDWVQCCRLGFGPPRGLHPPVTYVGKDGTPVCNSRVLPATEVPCLYQHQYRKSSASGTQSTNGANFCNST
ncbi:hypothetical protein RvY_05795 [Ramazzottius varieornatus]|uniref:Uncharacterized protein n=1 Tax=Ramazzottius varieornatus TaxID=947166 RepID=A0A1D1UWS3_RAMVA|nr:hypothetical protein RvY_05795 [Ramazzottius varieornatus]